MQTANTVSTKVEIGIVNGEHRIDVFFILSVSNFVKAGKQVIAFPEQINSDFLVLGNPILL
ncbi:MAG: hypothetical protein IPP60_11915 [Sphingobacteriales bacterium]|nr:hypothetical protein [Sphingobacteriales bacterium]